MSLQICGRSEVTSHCKSTQFSLDPDLIKSYVYSGNVGSVFCLCFIN